MDSTYNVVDDAWRIADVAATAQFARVWLRQAEGRERLLTEELHSCQRQLRELHRDQKWLEDFVAVCCAAHGVNLADIPEPTE